MLDGTQHLAGLREGQILVGKYRVERVIGMGGMCAVVAARHLQLDTLVAIKFLLPCMLGNAEAIARFAREARAALKLSNEHVARVFEVGTLVSGAPYMVREYLEGADLAAHLRELGPLSVADATDLVLQACEALAEAHSLGIVHRDLKPANLFCARRADGRKVVKVLDFGISNVSSLSPPPKRSPTQVGSPMGTPFYASPEQVAGSQAVDGRSDVWSVGIILYELLTGKLPFGGNTPTEVTVQIAARAPHPPLHELRPDLPRGLDAVVHKCLEKNPDERFPTVSDLAVALLPFCSDRGKISVDRIADVAPPSAPEPLLPPPAFEEAIPSSIRPSTRSAAWESAVEPAESNDAKPGAASLEPTPPPLSTRTPSSLPVVVDILPAAASIPPPRASAGQPPSSVPFSRTGAPETFPVGDSSRSAAARPARSVSRGVLLTAAILAIATVSAIRMTSTRAPDSRQASRSPTATENLPAQETPADPAGHTQGVLVPAAAAPSPPEANTLARAARPREPVPMPGAPRPRAPVSEGPGAQAPSPGSHADAKADCDPSFYFDGEGRKHFRPECFVAAPASAQASARAAKADCDPSFFLDEVGRKHFKPQCFLDSKR